MIEQNRVLVENLWVVDIEKDSIRRRISNELRGAKFIHMGRSYDRQAIHDIFSQYQFDAVWISDDGILDLIEVLRDFSSPKAIYIVGLNDCISQGFAQ